MATAAASPADNDTECSVCHELFTEPKLLPCAHLLCRHCLLSWLSSNPQALCPLCRCAIADPQRVKDAGSGWKKVVDALPTDVAMAALVDSTRVLGQDHECGGCLRSAAVSICLHCGDTLCATCTAAHGNLKATRHHRVEDLSTMTAERLAANQPASCGAHSDKPSELFCPTHGAAICHLCASSEHRACPQVMLFEKRVEQLREELSSMSDSLKAAEENLQDSIAELDRQLEETEMKTQKSIADIEEACDRLENSVKACRRRLRELALQAKRKVEKDVREIQDAMSDRRGRMASHRRVVDRVNRSSPPGKLEVATVTIRSRVNELDLKVTLDSKVVAMTTLRIDPYVLRRLERELSFLGEKEVPALGSEVKEWTFLKTKGVSVGDCGRTAERVSGTNAFAVTSTPMEVNMLYEVRIEEIRGRSHDCFCCGVVKSEPESLTFPATALFGWKDAIVFSRTLFKFGTEKDIGIEDKLTNLKAGTRVGFVRDSGGFLHLYIDGMKQWLYVRGAPTQCYVFFELHHIYSKVTALPLTFVEKALKHPPHHKSSQNLSSSSA